LILNEKWLDFLMLDYTKAYQYIGKKALWKQGEQGGLYWYMIPCDDNISNATSMHPVIGTELFHV